MDKTTRRNFLKAAAAAGIATAALNLQGDDQSNPVIASKPKRNMPIPQDTVHQFVRAAHSDLETVKSMLAVNPLIANATWDWGNGDYETALAGAAHMGRHDIAKVLINAGARPDSFYFAMSGDLHLVEALIKSHSVLVHNKGPHGISLLYHAAISANLELANLLQSHGAQADTRSLHASVNIAKSYPMTEWLLKNGAIYDAKPGFNGKPHAETARDNGLIEIADLLESHRQS